MRSKEYWIQWIQKAGIRAIKTMAQTAVANLGVVATTLGEINWMILGSTTLLSGILSLLSSLGGLPELEFSPEVLEEIAESSN